MSGVTIFADRNMRVAQVPDTLFSSFIEHMGRAVYTGIYEPGHPAADEKGFRRDVLALIQQLGVPMVRYPGGNFLSGYDWRDGIGPKEKRPTRLDLAWQTTETNQFGTDEFMDWCAVADITPMMAVNLGTGTPKEAAQLLEYCNHPGGSYFSDLRIANGHREPYGVKTWCLGNEMDGPWQICGMSAEDYAKKAKATAKMMRLVDPTIELVACGSSTGEMPTFPEWDRVVLDALYEDVDYISMHQYHWYEDSLQDFFASYHQMDQFIQTVKATADFVKAKHRSRKTMGISFDEWNVWYQNAQKPAKWAKAPHILEDIYSLKDALVFGGMLNTLLNNCDRVQVACLAQLVNVIAPIFTREGGEAIMQATYFPFEMVSRFGRGIVLRQIVRCEKMDSRYGPVDSVSSAVVVNDARREVSVFLANYNDHEMDCGMELRSLGELSAKACTVLDGEDLEAQNTLDAPGTIAPREGELPDVRGDHVAARLAPYSFTMLRLGY